MLYTFEDVWRKVLLHSPMAGPMLAREWVQWAWNTFCDRRGWSSRRESTAFSVRNQRSGTATMTQGSREVIPGTLTFSSSDVGRQFRQGTVPIYTIVAVNGANVLLDLPWADDTVTQTMQILDAYVTTPADFQRFIVCVDPVNRWRIKFWVNQDQLNMWDPVRQNTGNAYWLVSQKFSPVPGYENCARFELYPYQTGARSYVVFYFKKPGILTDDFQFTGPIADRADEILGVGALAQCARWPGVDGKKNPYFDLRLADMLEARFMDTLIQIAVKDDELYFESMPFSDYPFAPGFPFDSTWLQSHEPYFIG